MKLLVIAALAYYVSLQFVFPGYFQPLCPHHDDLYFPAALSFEHYSLWEKLQWPRPLGFLIVELLGRLGLQGYLASLVLITLANAALTMALVRRIFSQPVSWFLALAYCTLLFAHPDFYVNYLHDGFGTLSYFYLILAMHAWYAYRESGRARYRVACTVLMLLIGFTKETYFAAALLFWLAQIWLCHGAQRRAGAWLFVASLTFFAAGLGFNAHSLAVLHVKTDAASPYHVTLAPAAVARGFLFYASRLFHPAVLALIVAGISMLYRSREQIIMAGTLAAAGLCALVPNSMLPNHLDSMYAWTGATLAFSPVLFLSRPVGTPSRWRTGAVYAGVAALTLLSIRTSTARYEEHRWAIAQEKINRNILDSFPVLKGLDASAKNVLITGLDMPFQPFHKAGYIHREFGSGREWTVVVPRGAAAKSDPPVRCLPPDAVQLHDYDAAFGFGEDGRLVNRWTRAQLQQASTRRQIDGILFPALNPIFDELAKEPDKWNALLRAGVIYSQWGELDTAADLLGRSAELNHQNPYPLFFLGKVRESQGMLAEARRYYQQAVDLDSGQPNPAFREALERLRGK